MEAEQRESATRVELEVFRFLPDNEQEPRFQTYKVPFHDDWVVLDALNYIRDEVDPTLSFRWSCRMGVCGSCGMMVNGEPRLTCEAFVKEYGSAPIRIEPLAHFPVIRDLVINMDDFMEKLPAVKAWLIPGEHRSLEDGEYLQSPAQLAKYKHGRVPAHLLRGGHLRTRGKSLPRPRPCSDLRLRRLPGGDGMVRKGRNDSARGQR